jgi:hypothetical protein
MIVKIIVIFLFLLGTIFIAVLIYGRSQWDKQVNDFLQKLSASNKRIRSRISFEDLSELPKPVQRYFKLVIKDGAPSINKASITQKGGFRAKPDAESWSKMNALQTFISDRRGFIWDAKIKMAPLTAARVLDSYINGKGRMLGKILSLFTIVDESNKKELNKGALQRFLAESVWFPTVLLPGKGVIWSKIDDKTARATINDSGITASMDFEFNENGEIISAFTEARYREVNGKYKLYPWKGKFREYIDIDGYLIPSIAEVEWVLEDGAFPYWRGELVNVEYD